MKTNFFKAVILGMKELGQKTLFLLRIYVGCFILPTLCLIFAKNLTELIGTNYALAITFASILINVFIYSFIEHCVDAAIYSKKHNVDIKEAYKATRVIDNSDDPI